MELGDLYPIVVTVVLIGVVLGLGLYILTEFRGKVATEYAGEDNDIYVNATEGNFTTLSDSTKTGYYLRSVVVINATVANDIVSSHYAIVSPTAGTINWTNADWGDGEGTQAVNISSVYIWDAAESPEAAVSGVKQGTDDFADWMAIIMIVIAAGIVLGLVVRSFAKEPGV